MFDYNKMDPDSLLIDDIAQALSIQTRFAGHCTHHYSVAQHSVLVSEVMERMYYASYRQSEDALEASLYGLMHDAAEAYVGDIPAPLKGLPELSGYNMVEHRVVETIFRKFKVRPTVQSRAILAIVDTHIRVDEATKLMPGGIIVDMGVETGLAPTWMKKIAPWSSKKAKTKFLERYNWLKEVTG
jgi:hypothetical protein